MPRYRNTDTHTRRWDNLTHPDGGTLQLDPGEEVELRPDALPEDFDDPFLKPARPSKPKASKPSDKDAAETHTFDVPDLADGRDGDSDPSAIPVA